MSSRELEPYCQLELTHTKTTKSTFRNGSQGSPPPSILVTISVPETEA